MRLSQSILKHRVVVRRASVSTNALGEDVRTWADAATARMNLVYEGASERIRADRIEGRQAATFRFRGDVDVQESDRLSVDGNEFEVQGPPYEIQRVPRWLEVVGVRVT